MNYVLIALGSNMQREANVPAAIEALRSHPAILLRAVSPVYETVPIGRNGQPSDQPTFHNGAALLETDLSPDELLSVLRQIEAQLGRVRGADKFDARPIDLDIALVRQKSARSNGVVQADPDIARFIHLSAPLADLAPDWVMPQTGETLRQLADRHWAESSHPPTKQR